MLAASQVEASDDREATIVGSIAATLIDSGHFLPHLVAAHAAESMAWGYTVARDIDKSIDENGYAGPVVTPLPDRMFPKVLRGYPTMAEIAIAARKFKHFYDPPAGVAA